MSMSSEWSARVLSLATRTTEAEDNEFVELVDQAMDRCDLETAKTLMKTFNASDDSGVQESVVSVLASAPTEIYHHALLEELARLLDEAPDWSETLVGREVEHEPDSLVSVANRLSNDVREKLRLLLDNNSFREFYDNASEVLSELK